MFPLPESVPIASVTIQGVIPLGPPLDPPDFELVVRGPSDGRGNISRRITGSTCCGLSRDIYSRAACDARRSYGGLALRVVRTISFPESAPPILTAFGKLAFF